MNYKYFNLNNIFQELG